jgi:hypothetical protein
VLVSFGEAAEPALFVEVRSWASSFALGSVQGGNEVMGEEYAVEWGWGHILRAGQGWRRSWLSVQERVWRGACLVWL